ncbi:hypothetical protein OnM2_080042 [Erysiphe neolycopersici]|uniref:Uncharacterized protein n=1 Tax=Erysiphe neolycopersici TaxID=212602 RepID=A0A420HGM1_9PEZI|nr:hypothetical protein OnM2_080042 [Erysiphe neolycopersici]
MGNNIGIDTEFETMEIDNMFENAETCQVDSVNENQSSWIETVREERQFNSTLTLNEQNLARLIAQQIQLLVAPLAAKVNELSNEITKIQPISQQKPNHRQVKLLIRLYRSNLANDENFQKRMVKGDHLTHLSKKLRTVSKLIGISWEAIEQSGTISTSLCQQPPKTRLPFSTLLEHQSNGTTANLSNT